MNAIVPQIHLLDLNQTCNCMPIDRKKIEQKIFELSGEQALQFELTERENYFAATAVFVSEDDVAAMMAQIKAIENLATLPAFQDTVLTRTPDQVSVHQPETRGAFMGYDFHITAAGPRLIEVNSNAGGAGIVGSIEQAIGRDGRGSENLIRHMFEREWVLAGRTTQLKTIAIIDSQPKDQFHYPDMCLTAASLRRQGFEVIIADPCELRRNKSGIYIDETRIDLIYNRLTDFALEDPENRIVRDAFIDDKIVLTPSPRHHALYADKRNLILWSDLKLLQSWNVPEQDLAVLAQIPPTVEVTPEYADWLWAQRRQYFFKPKAGFGSRATYRGSKLTKKVWAHIVKGGYVAQKFISPPLRLVERDAETVELKYDVRVYTYEGRALLLAARVYQGQTTNMRTVGGGLAPIIVMDAQDKACTV